MEGVVIKSTGSRYLVKTKERVYECVLKGKIRLEGRKTTNPIAVGDIVDFDIEENDEASIKKIHPRKNYIIRKSINLSKQSQILASNLDQTVLIVTLVSPRTSLGFIDRFLITSEAYRIPAKLIFNKCDLLNEESLTAQKEIIQLYTDIGYECFEVSSYDLKQIEALKQVFENKTTLIAGHSGVGKSTFINALQPGLNLKTGEISSAHAKGMHTTTFAELHSLDFGGSIIDSPGIKELGLVEMKKEEIGHYFPEIRERMNDCKFNNCIHVNEPKCAIIAAVEKGEISEERYSSYLGILSGEEMDWKAWEI
ncbi:ribosome small subunit-dependent GTPase A [Aurantibacillus circumpalustris]|uniref:ribosome small subunit-dependent GTPase A n=1 Tax=Aurantibacillus circumpalustris TaxID=3036359 RepID=UPI00295A86E7|nr:ribosome small subunit-dependent GTPase A [Aurantibacillus circumpalustris]